MRKTLPVINYLNTGGSANYGNDRTFPGLTIGVDQDNFVIEATATITIPAPGYWTFGVNSDDGFQLTIGSFTMSYPDPRGPGDTLQTFYFPAAGDYPLDLIFYECGGGSEVELYAAQGSFGSWNSTNFRLVGDIANGGLAVQAPVVSGGGGTTSYRPLIATDVQAQMDGVNGSAYLRVPFYVNDPAALESLTLRMKYDDGFIAYLNGTRIASRNAPAVAQWNSVATASHPNYQALIFEDINVSDFLSLLQTGWNVLAIQGLNQTAADFDFLILPELVEYKAGALTNMYFATPTPGGLNNSGFVAFVADTKFSPNRGFYDTPIQSLDHLGHRQRDDHLHDEWLCAFAGQRHHLYDSPGDQPHSRYSRRCLQERIHAFRRGYPHLHLRERRGPAIAQRRNAARLAFQLGRERR